MKQHKLFLLTVFLIFVKVLPSQAVDHLIISDLFLDTPQHNSSSRQIAGIYWLPDYVQENDGYGYGNPNNDKHPSGGGGIDEGEGRPESCNSYVDHVVSCTPPMTGTRVRLSSGLVCYKNCQCPSSYVSSCSAGFQLAGGTCGSKRERCDIIPCPEGSSTNPRCGSDETIQNNGFQSGAEQCKVCVAMTCNEKCSGYQQGLTCGKGQTKSQCSSSCGAWERCEGELCPTPKVCDIGCQAYSGRSECSDVCIECETCTPTPDETGCAYGTVNADDGCDGLYKKCCNPSNYNDWSVSPPSGCSQGSKSVTNSCGINVYKCKTCEEVGKIDLDTCWNGGALKCLIPAN